MAEAELKPDQVPAKESQIVAEPKPEVKPQGRVLRAGRRSEKASPIVTKTSNDTKSAKAVNTKIENEVKTGAAGSKPIQTVNVCVAEEMATITESSHAESKCDDDTPAQEDAGVGKRGRAGSRRSLRVSASSGSPATQISKKETATSTASKKEALTNQTANKKEAATPNASRKDAAITNGSKREASASNASKREAAATPTTSKKEANKESTPSERPKRTRRSVAEAKDS